MRRPHEITYKGKTQCLAHWAQEFGISNTAFSCWFYDYGIETAIEMACMSREERKEYKAKLRGDDPKTTPDLEPYDPDLEMKNRLQHWLAVGMTKEEIAIKARMI